MNNCVNISNELLGKFRDFVSERMGLYYNDANLLTLLKGVEKATNTFGYRDVKTCIQQMLKIKWNEAEIQTLASYLTVGETYFFRHIEQYDYFIDKILKKELLASPNHKELKIWSAGCCTGEEAYTFAIMLKHNLPLLNRKLKVTIVGTDINPVYLAKAKEGLYSKHSFRKTPKNIVNKYFTKMDKMNYKLNSEIKEMVTFDYLNLGTDSYPLKKKNVYDFDVVFCRNVFIYFNEKTIEDVVSRMQKTLRKNGCFFVSPTETMMIPRSIFHAVRTDKLMIFKKTVSKQHKTLLPLKATKNLTDKKSSSASYKKAKPIEKIGRNAVKQKQFDQIKEKPISLENVMQSVDVLMKDGRYEALIPLIKDDILQKTKNKQLLRYAYQMLTNVYVNIGEVEEAIKVCKKAIASDKLSPEMHYLHSTVLFNAGKRDEAIVALKKVLYLNNQHIMANFTLGNLYRNLGRRKNAEKYFKKTLSFLNILPKTQELYDSGGITAGNLINMVDDIIKAENI